MARMPKRQARHMVRHAARKGLKALAKDHPAVVEGRTLFPTRVVDVEHSKHLMVSGFNNRKVGVRVVRGQWKGAPIWMLSLEERKTCPRACHHWRTCYGNNMQYALRRDHTDPPFLTTLWRELNEKQTHANKHVRDMRVSPLFVVRLHVLGDFYSVKYVEFWMHALNLMPGLRIFGSTAWPRDTEIGAAVWRLNEEFPGRVSLRTSVMRPIHGKMELVSIAGPLDLMQMDAAQCRAQTDDDMFCGNCTLCWATKKNIALEGH